MSDLSGLRALHAFERGVGLHPSKWTTPGQFKARKRQAFREQCRRAVLARKLEKGRRRRERLRKRGEL